MYALVRTGGKQYRVEEGRSIKIERLPGDAGDTVELGEVLLMADGDAITVGAPTIEGARIVGTIAEQGRAKKILVFHYRNKTRHRKKNGHRQQFTRLVVDDILGAGQEPKPKAAKAETVATAAPVAEAPKGRRGRKSEPEAAAVDTPPAGDTLDEPSVAPAPVAEKPKRTRKKAE